MAQGRRLDWGEGIVPALTLVFVLAFFFQTWDGPRSALYWPVGVAVVLGIFWVPVVLKFLVS